MSIAPTGGFQPIPIPGGLPPASVIRKQLEAAEKSLEVARARTNGTNPDLIERLEEHVKLLKVELHWAGVLDAARGARDTQRQHSPLPLRVAPPHDSADRS